MHSLPFGQQLRLLFQMRNRQVWRNNGKRILIVDAIMFVIFFFVYLPKQSANNAAPFLFDGSDIGNIPINALIYILIGEVLFKLIMKADPPSMDDFARSRPVSNRVWNVFTLLRTITNPIYLTFPMLWAAVSFANMPVPLALIATLVGLIISTTISAIISVRARCQGWEYKLTFWIAAIISLAAMVLYALNLFKINGLVLLLTFIALCAMIIVGFYIFGCYLPNYAEKTVSRSRTKNKRVGLFPITLTYMLRSPGGKLFYFFPLFFVTLAVLFFKIPNDQLTPDAPDIVRNMPLIMLYLGSIILAFSIGLNTLGAEANFIDGLWTRPFSLRKFLIYKYYFYSLTSLTFLVPFFIVAAILGIFSVVPILLILSMMLYVIGFQMFFFFPSIFTTPRIPLEMQTAINANPKGNLAALPMMLISIIPLALFYLANVYLPQQTAYIIISCVGAIGLIFHRKIIYWFADRYTKNRYKYFEKYRQ